ncbi:hypothetical protein PLICRDRAFT_174939 [Plicaturopsis crispa FD-325 SS-3]|nr:hypothetical protein PLICRDRAFT_174939 [Plicaturopsis crispa FD-325 SS-3]
MSSLPADLKPLTGPFFIGAILNWLFLGCLTVQVYIYSLSNKHDRAGVKSLVYSVYIIDVAQTVVTTHASWETLVAKWGNPEVLVLQPWSVCALPIFGAIVSCMVQLFFAWRIWKLQRSMIMRLICVVIVLIALMQSISAIVGSIRFALILNGGKIHSLFLGFAIWLGGSFLCDILITLSMMHILREARAQSAFSSTDTVVTKLIVLTVQTGLVTAVTAGVDLILFLVCKNNYIYDAPAFIIGKIYSNVLLATLNARTNIARSSHDTESGPNNSNLALRLGGRPRTSQANLRTPGLGVVHIATEIVTDDELDRAHASKGRMSTPDF